LFYVGVVLIARGTYTYLQMVEVLSLVVFTVSIGSQHSEFSFNVPSWLRLLTQSPIYCKIRGRQWTISIGLLNLETSTKGSRGILRPGPHYIQSCRILLPRTRRSTRSEGHQTPDRGRGVCRHRRPYRCRQIHHSCAPPASTPDPSRSGQTTLLPWTSCTYATTFPSSARTPNFFDATVAENIRTSVWQ
jgi:hypothetical protein